MSILFMSFFAVMIFLMYVNSLFTPFSETKESQDEIRKALQEMEDADVPASWGKNLTKGTGVFLVIVYTAFYITAAIILNQLVFTLITALFIVLSVRSMFRFFKVIDGTLELEPKWYSKLNSIIGMLYTGYFFVQYYNMHTDNFSSLILGAAVAIILSAIAKAKAEKNKQERKAKREKEEAL